MKYIRRTYIEFLYPSFLFDDNKSTQQVKDRDVSKVKVPKNAFGFKFFDILSVVVDIDSKKIQFTSKRINFSPMHYYGGKVYTMAEIKRDFPDEYTSINDCGCPKVIRCRTENWKPFEDADVFVEAI